MKKIISLLVCTCMLITLAACQNKREEDTPSKVTAAFFEACRTKDLDKIKEFSKWEDYALKALDIQESDYIDGVDKKLQKEVYAKMLSFKDEEGKESINGDSASVQVTLMIYDFTPTVTQGLKEATTKAEELSRQEDITDARAQAEINTVIFKNLNKAKMSLKKEVTIKLVKEDDEWFVTKDNKDFEKIFIDNLQSLNNVGK
ncbi:MAG: hypothetical protein RR441_08945 [Longicatena sp.]